MDRMARTVAWEQRHEQILNEATPTLAHAGDLPRTTDRPQQVSSPAESSRHPAGDACQAAFTQVVDLAPAADRPAKDAMNTIRRSDTGPM
jgi:hypothetical protein